MLLFCFTSFSVKPSPISQLVKIKIETNRDLVHCSFLRLTQFASIFYGFFIRVSAKIQSSFFFSLVFSNNFMKRNIL